MTGWTEPRIDVLKALWRDGLSASQIASELGDITRNGVISKVHRLGLSARDRPLGKPHRAVQNPYKRQLVPRMVPKPRMGPHGHMIAAEEIVYEAAPDVVANPLNVALVDLEPHHCRWPYGDRAPYFFCGQGKIDDSSYCHAHASLSRGGSPPSPRALPVASRTGVWQ